MPSNGTTVFGSHCNLASFHCFALICIFVVQIINIHFRLRASCEQGILLHPMCMWLWTNLHLKMQDCDVWSQLQLCMVAPICPSLVSSISLSRLWMIVQKTFIDHPGCPPRQYTWINAVANLKSVLRVNYIINLASFGDFISALQVPHNVRKLQWHHYAFFRSLHILLYFSAAVGHVLSSHFLCW